MNDRIVSLERFAKEQNNKIVDLEKVNQMLQQRKNEIQDKAFTVVHTETQVADNERVHVSEGTDVDPVYVNIEDEDDEEKVDYEDSDFDEYPGLGAFNDDDGDVAGIGGSSGLNSITGAIVVYGSSEISLNVNPVSSVDPCDSYYNLLKMSKMVGFEKHVETSMIKRGYSLA
ncbi:hypothetical protein R6Q59_012384 [Mikania micrantha]